ACTFVYVFARQEEDASSSQTSDQFIPQVSVRDYVDDKGRHVKDIPKWYNKRSKAYQVAKKQSGNREPMHHPDGHYPQYIPHYHVATHTKKQNGKLMNIHFNYKKDDMI